MVLPNPPPDFFSNLNSILFRFIWNNKPDKVKRSILCSPVSNGGLKMVDLYSFANSLKCKWVKLYLDDCNRPWKPLFDYTLRNYGKSFLFNCNFSSNDIDISNTFILHVCQAWANFNFRQPENNNCANQTVLNNSFIKINNKLIFNKRLLSNNAHLIKDFCDEDGNPIDYNVFINKFNIRRLPFTICFGIIKAIPITWKNNYIIQPYT